MFMLCSLYSIRRTATSPFSAPDDVRVKGEKTGSATHCRAYSGRSFSSGEYQRMKLFTKTLIAGLVLVAGVAFAKEGVQDATVKARMDLMGTIGKNTKVLGDMAGEKVAFDAAAAQDAKAALMAASADIPAKFEPAATDPVSEAKPEIWTNWDDFMAKGNALNAAATALDASSLDSVKAGMGAIGGSCKDCHSTYRM
jgi:cytochrome c556